MAALLFSLTAAATSAAGFRKMPTEIDAQPDAPVHVRECAASRTAGSIRVWLLLHSDKAIGTSQITLDFYDAAFQYRENVSFAAPAPSKPTFGVTQLLRGEDALPQYAAIECSIASASLRDGTEWHREVDYHPRGWKG